MGLGIYGQLGLGDTDNRLVPTLVGAEELFGGSKVRTVSCGDEHTLVVTEAGELWACGKGAQGGLGLNDEHGRLVPTRVDPQHFAHAPISAAAAGGSHSAAVTARGALYTWGRALNLGQRLRHCRVLAPRHLPGGLLLGPRHQQYIERFFSSLGKHFKTYPQRENIPTANPTCL